MLSVISVEETDKWNQIVKSFPKWDIYYLNEYARTFQIHGDGTPFLIDYLDKESHFCYVVMKKDISDDFRFKGYLERDKYFDYESPYGYGGPMIDSELSETSQRRFMNELSDYCHSKGIVSQFIRFHPLYSNYKVAPSAIETRYMHDVIYINTMTHELIMNNMDGKNRNMIRKAVKNDVSIIRQPVSDYHEFLIMYEETMKKDKADKYYYFSKEYFEAQRMMSNNACIFYAIRNDMPIAGAIMYFNNYFMHYHLAGSHTEYRKYSPNNLLLYEAACWASDNGIKEFNLGGGMLQDDRLFSFKKKFNKNGRLPFYIGRTIFDTRAYEYLKHLRMSLDSSYISDNNRMIQYRA